MRLLGFDLDPTTMILKFPDLNTLRLGMTTGGVPINMSQAGAVAGFDGDVCFVETSAALARTNENELEKLGVTKARSWPGALEKTEVSCWAEILPLEHDRNPVDHLEQTPVLFDLPSGEELARLVIEVLRLGNDRQGFRWLEDSSNGDSPRALLRVIGPPYYSLLRALDRIGGNKAPVAYVERSPRIWVELGYSHPMIGQIKPPTGKLLLIRPPRMWTLLDEASFRDVYENMEFQLPDRKVPWKDTKLDKVLPVKMSLRAGGSTDDPELWVLQDSPMEQLNAFVQNSGDEDLQRLSFAVGEKAGKKTIVVRVRQSSRAKPPVLVFKNAVAYKHYQKMPNLFVPAGMYIHPNLRRDQLRKLLADDTSQVVWLHPGDKGIFTPMSLPEDSFRPLWDWIDYVLDHEKEPLQAWVQAAQFDFEAFVCEEDPSTKPKKPPSQGDAKPRGSRDRGGREGPTTEVNFAPLGDDSEKVDEIKVQLEEFGAGAKVEPTQLQKDLKDLEENFLASEGGLDTPERQEMWPRLASLNTQLKNVDDAGICWLNAMWERDDHAAKQWAWHWFLNEAGSVAPRGEGRSKAATLWVAKAAASKNREVPADDLDKLLSFDEPNTSDLRALAAYLAHAALQDPPSAVLKSRVGQVSAYLEQHEKLLPVRAMWMAWVHLTRLSASDVLALARARDRLLERLYHNGLRPEQDLPSFLRFAGQPTSQRFRAVRQWMSELGDLAQTWLKDSAGGTAPASSARTPAYVDLLFSFGLARLGENDAARELLARAKQSMFSPADDAHMWLYNAFECRIKQALDGKSPTGPLPTDQLEYLEKVERLQRYVVDRLRKHSSVLEPDQRINPYRHWGARISDFEKAIAELTDLTDRNEIANRIDKLLREVPKGARGNEQKARVLRAGLEAAPRVGEEFARKLLDQTVPAYDGLPEAKEMAPLMEQATFLEKALFVAGHFGRVESIHPLVTRFQRMLQSTTGAMVFNALESVAKQCFRGLRKLGMRDEIDQILRQMAELVLKGREIKAVDFKKEDQGSAALRSLLQVAGQWYYFGRDSQAEPILQVARSVLLANDLPPREQTQLAVAYAAAVGEAPVEIAQKRLEEVFRQLKGIKDTYTTSSHFSVSQLDVVEAVVLAVVGDNFTQGTQARRWLDDDEFLVRRRIHRDLRSAMERG